MTKPTRRCVECGKKFTPHHASCKLCSHDCRRRRRTKQIMAWQKANSALTLLRRAEGMARKRLDPAYRELERAQQREYRKRRDQET